MGWFWAEQHAGRVAHLVGASPDAISLALEPLPADAPAVVTCYPRVSPGVSPVAAILAELEQTVIDLYPAWLDGASELDGPQRTRQAAVRALALERESATARFGPYLADLAVRAAGGLPRRHRAPAEVRAAGLATVLAESYQRPYPALLLHVPDGLPVAETEQLVSAGEWLARHGGFAVWLTGTDLCPDHRVPAVAVALPDRVSQLGDTGVAKPEVPRTTLRCPPVAGRPAPRSASEHALEAALAPQLWAAGRSWNQPLRTDPLAEEIRVDLLWEAERCAVEIDGEEHRGALHFEQDRRRDVRLQLAGFAVLRFTDRQVEHDLAAVLAQIEQLLTSRRREPAPPASGPS